MASNATELHNIGNKLLLSTSGVIGIIPQSAVYGEFFAPISLVSQLNDWYLDRYLYDTLHHVYIYHGVKSAPNSLASRH